MKGEAGTLGVLGGTFDPVHHGHLRLALEALHQLELRRVLLVPANVPPHRGAPRASGEERLAMLNRAVAGVPRIAVDERELLRPGPSWTCDTLEALRTEAPTRPLVLLIGADQFAELDTWHRWEELTTLAHIAVARRPGCPIPESGPVAEHYRAHAADNPLAVHNVPCGHIVLLDVPQLDIRGTRIRAEHARGHSVRYLVPERVLEYIEEEGLYRHEQ